MYLKTLVCLVHRKELFCFQLRPSLLSIFLLLRFLNSVFLHLDFGFCLPLNTPIALFLTLTLDYDLDFVCVPA